MLKRLFILTWLTLVLSACEEKTEVNTSNSAEKPADKSAAPVSTPAPDEKNPEVPSEEAPQEKEGKDENAALAKKTPLSNHYVIAANQLAGSNMTAAEKQLGKPQKAENIRFRYAGTSGFIPAVTKYYMQGQAAVTFVENIAARVVFTPDEPISFEDELPKALELAGLPNESEPFEETGTAKMYENIGGVYSVTAFKKAELVDYLYIVLEEKYK